jgi:hypothetical protein
VRTTTAIAALVSLTLAAACGSSPTATEPAPPGVTATSSPPATAAATPAPGSPPAAAGSPAGLLAAIDATLAHRTGRYLHRVSSLANESIVRWIDYDLDRSVHDQRIALWEPGGPEPTRGAAELRAVVIADRMLIWLPAIEEACGTAWFEMPPGIFEEQLGLPVDLFHDVGLPPVDLLEPYAGSASLRGPNRFELSMPALDLMPTTQDLLEDEELLSALEDHEVFVDVKLADGLVTAIEADLSAAITSALGSPPIDDALRVSWELQAGAPVEVFEMPSRLADPACIDE